MARFKYCFVADRAHRPLAPASNHGCAFAVGDFSGADELGLMS